MRKNTALGTAYVLTAIGGVLAYAPEDAAWAHNLLGLVLLLCVFFWGAGLLMKD
jgi:4-hydroxybenzoate polyprenyltransferase